MNEQNLQQPNVPTQNPNNHWVFAITILATALIVGGVVYGWQRSIIKSSQQNYQQQLSKLQNQIDELQSQINNQNNQNVLNEEQNQNNNEQTNTNPTNNLTNNWQIYSDSSFSYQCPADWVLGSNKNYGGQVNLSSCEKLYQSNGMSFDDGVAITFGFVPQSVADNYKNAGEKWSESLLNDIKNQSNAKEYSNNNFVGWILENQGYTLRLIARYQVNGGYFEVQANAAGNTKTSQEYKQIVDNIISTFKAK